MSKRTSRSRKLLVSVLVAAVIALIAGGLFAYNKWRTAQPITFEGKITKFQGGLGGDNGCGIDDSCRMTIDGKAVITDCGWGNSGEECPRRLTPSTKLLDLSVGQNVRVTVQKNKTNDYYNLHCEMCDVTILH
jgi:hypothetical protein